MIKTMTETLDSKMAAAEEPLTDAALLDLVEHEIALRQNGSSGQFHVQRNGIKHDGSWTYILVLPEPADMRAYKYSLFLDEIEEAVEKQTNIKLLLVPAMQD